ncbi:RrF2 family transcriptional regulator [Cesiribacter andamanensis]|uniref:Transcriptional repressor NsrR n=1 Tax=Cesiribacter andamanensis AMV16 TaxID=1279009 RepID=M7NVA4_9BACT|nr:Rrf2 family transcriptional regulator [Cesiribacter andamanensis]EMR02389.1 transcriptional repressor NsrR [Cesiribacter andamanensis AMV16]
MLSYTCKTAIKAVIYLATTPETGLKKSIGDIADHIGASGHTVSKMLQTLVKRGVINSTKGPSGGFYMSREQTLQPIMHIVDAIDGMGLFKECGLGLSQCSETHPCPIHEQYKKPRELLEKLFRENRVEDLRQPVNSGLAYLIG